jgi:molybdate transport system substrate-binding protein
MTKPANLKPSAIRFSGFGFGDLGLFRISDFGFRISAPVVGVLTPILLAGGLGCSGMKPGAAGREVRIAAAADLRFALDEIVAEFQRRHPDIRVTVTPGSSGNFFAQLSNRGPFDLFLSADVEYPRRLVEQSLAEKDNEFVYAIGHLVVWVRNDSPLDLKQQGVRAVLDPCVHKVAIANPRYAPYGRAAETALKKLGLYDKVKGRLVLGDNVAQTAQFVDTGAADVGLIALSLALAPTLREKGRYAEVPADAYPRMEQAGVILSWAQDREAAEAVRDFLLGPEGKAILRRYGFSEPPASPKR